MFQLTFEWKQNEKRNCSIKKIPLNQTQFRCIHWRHPHLQLFVIWSISVQSNQKGVIEWFGDPMVLKIILQILNQFFLSVFFYLCCPNASIKFQRYFTALMYAHAHTKTFNRIQRLSWLFCNDCPKRLSFLHSLFIYLLLHLKQKPQIVGVLTIKYLYCSGRKKNRLNLCRRMF